MTRPTQSMMYIPFQVNTFHKIILLIVQYKYWKSCSEDFILKNPSKIWSSAQDHAVLDSLLNIVGFFISARQKSACRKWFVPQLYQHRRGIFEGPALQYVYMIHRCGRYPQGGFGGVTWEYKSRFFDSIESKNQFFARFDKFCLDINEEAKTGWGNKK